MSISNSLDDLNENIGVVRECLDNIMDVLRDIKYTDKPKVQDLLDSFEFIGGEAEEALSYIGDII